MKKTICLFASIYLFVFLIVGVMSATSCSKLETEFEASYDADLEVYTARDMDGAFSAYATINPDDNSDFRKNKDKIKNIDIISVSGKVIETNKSFLLSAILSVYSDKNSTGWTVSGLPVSVGTVLTLGNEDGQWDIIKQIANEKKTYHVSLIGNTSEDDISLTVRVTIKYRVTAKAI